MRREGMGRKREREREIGREREVWESIHTAFKPPEQRDTRQWLRRG